MASKASKAQRGAAVKAAIEAARKGRATSAKVAREQVTDAHLVAIAQGEVAIEAGMAADLAATLAGIEQRAAKAVEQGGRTWGDRVNQSAYDAKLFEAKVPGQGRAVGANADEAHMVEHIKSWVERYGPKAASKASREYQSLNPRRGCWPVYRRLFGEYVGNAVEVAKGVAMTSKAATYSDASFVTSFATWLATAAADEGHEHHAVAMAAVQQGATLGVEATPAPAPAPAPAKARKAASPKARKAAAPKAAKAKATPRKRAAS